VLGVLDTTNESVDARVVEAGVDNDGANPLDGQAPVDSDSRKSCLLRAHRGDSLPVRSSTSSSR
jgi:hypothetical protein